MSVGQLLQTVRDHLRTQLTLDFKSCGVQLNGVPPSTAGEFYVAIDEDGTESVGGDDPVLNERYRIVISIMRRAGKYPKDRQGDLLLRETEALKSLEELERLVIKNIHAAWNLMATYNTNLGAPDATLGDTAILPLFCRGRGRTYTWTSPTEEPDMLYAWLRKDVRFSGMNRKQRLESMG